MQFLSVAPILPVKDVDAAAARYARLGFKIHLYQERLEDGRAFYGFLHRDEIAMHLALAEDLVPARSATAVYIYVDDPDALYAEWSAVADVGTLVAPEDKPWGVREMTYSDPDGNLLRIGRIL